MASYQFIFYSDSEEAQVVKNRLFQDVGNLTKEYVVCEITGPFDYSNPKIIIDATNMNVNGGYPFYFKYVSVRLDYKRTYYYFIDHFNCLANNITEVYLKLDVLATYSTNILYSKLYIARSSNTKYTNNELIDNLVPLEDTFDISHSVLTNMYPKNDVRNTLHTFQITNFESYSTQSLQYVVVVGTAEQGLTGMQSYAVPSGSFMFDQRGSYNKGFGSTSALAYAMTYSQLQTFLAYIYANSSYSSYLLGVYFYPFNIKDCASLDQTTVMHIGLKTISFSMGDFYIVRGCYFQVGDFYLNPLLSNSGEYNLFWTGKNINKYQLYLPFVGFINIPSSMIMQANNRFQVVYVVDFVNATCLCTVSEVKFSHIIYSAPCSIASEITSFASNSQSIRDAFIQSAIRGTIGLVAAGIDKYVGMPFGGARALSATQEGFGQQLSLGMTYHDIGSVATSGSANVDILGCITPYLITYVKDALFDVSDESDFVQHYGLPVESFYSFNALKQTDYEFTYVKTAIKYLPFMPNTISEYNEIISLLNNGIYIPNSYSKE